MSHLPIRPPAGTVRLDGRFREFHPVDRQKKGTAPGQTMDETYELFLHVRLWLEDGNEFALGPGRVHLLEEIRERGSLHQAAKALRMSYRRAWGQLKKLEESLGMPLVAKTGGNKAGYELTEEAEALMAAYTEWERQVTRFALEKSRELFPDYVHASVGDCDAASAPQRRKKGRSSG